MSDIAEARDRAVDPDEIYTRQETAYLAKTSVRSIDRDVAAGNLEIIKVGNLVRITGRAIRKRFGMPAV